MPTSTVIADTPYYVLMDGNRRIGPKVVQLELDAEIECTPIYGFSDKGPYDKFLANSRLALTPYPLNKVYLHSQTDAPGDGLKLVVFDAAGPRDPCLHAATMDAVLDAQENRTTHVTMTHEFVFDPQSEAYRVQEGFA